MYMYTMVQIFLMLIDKNTIQVTFTWDISVCFVSANSKSSGKYTRSCSQLNLHPSRKVFVIIISLNTYLALQTTLCGYGLFTHRKASEMQTGLQGCYLLPFVELSMVALPIFQSDSLVQKVGVATPCAWKDWCIRGGWSAGTYNSKIWLVMTLSSQDSVRNTTITPWVSEWQISVTSNSRYFIRTVQWIILLRNMV